jgi:hypothetical protein
MWGFPSLLLFAWWVPLPFLVIINPYFLSQLCGDLQMYGQNGMVIPKPQQNNQAESSSIMLQIFVSAATACACAAELGSGAREHGTW